MSDQKTQVAILFKDGIEINRIVINYGDTAFCDMLVARGICDSYEIVDNL